MPEVEGDVMEIINRMRENSKREKEAGEEVAPSQTTSTSAIPPSPDRTPAPEQNPKVKPKSKRKIIEPRDWVDEAKKRNPSLDNY